MLDHITLYAFNFDKNKHFYTAALKPLGYEIFREKPESVAYAVDGKPDFWIRKAEKKHEPTHIAFAASNKKSVNDFYTAAIAAGGVDDGAPGLRKQYHENYYAAFVLDPSGNHIETVCHANEK